MSHYTDKQKFQLSSLKLWCSEWKMAKWQMQLDQQCRVQVVVCRQPPWTRARSKVAQPWQTLSSQIRRTKTTDPLSTRLKSCLHRSFQSRQLRSASFVGISPPTSRQIHACATLPFLSRYVTIRALLGCNSQNFKFSYRIYCFSILGATKC